MDVVDLRAKPPKRIFMRWKNIVESPYKNAMRCRITSKKKNKPNRALSYTAVTFLLCHCIRRIYKNWTQTKKDTERNKNITRFCWSINKMHAWPKQHLCELHCEQFWDALRSRFGMALFSFFGSDDDRCSQRCMHSGMCMWAAKCCRFYSMWFCVCSSQR